MIPLALIGVGALVLLRLLRLPLRILGASALAMAGGGAAALLLGPTLSPTDRPKQAGPPPTSMAAERHAFTGQFTPGENWLRLSDGFASRGKSDEAAGILISAVREHPRDYSLWVGLGNALVAHSGGLTPGSQMAFDEARMLAPGYPAPRYFYGVALARSSRVAEARQWWTRMLADAPAEASWRPLVEDRLAETAPPTGPTPR